MNRKRVTFKTKYGKTTFLLKPDIKNLESENAELKARWEELEARYERLVSDIDYHKNGLCSCKSSLECLMRLSKNLESGGEVPHDKLGAELTNWEAALSVSGTPKPERKDLFPTFPMKQLEQKKVGK